MFAKFSLLSTIQYIKGGAKNETCIRDSARCSHGLSAHALNQLHILDLDGDPLGMNAVEVGVFKEMNEVSLKSFLQGNNCGALPTDTVGELGHGHHVVGDLADKALEGQLTYQQLSGMLEAKTTRMIEEETLEFIKTNMNHLPMYYIPGKEFK